MFTDEEIVRMIEEKEKKGDVSWVFGWGVFKGENMSVGGWFIDTS